MTDTDVCALCGHTDKRDLGTRLVHWRASPPGMAYEHVLGCRDVEACRGRVANQGAVWPLIETTGDRRRAS